MKKIEALELDTWLTFDKPLNREDIMFESLNQKELHQLKCIDIDSTYITELSKIMKSGRSAYLLSVFGEEMEDKQSGFWESAAGEYGWIYLEFLYHLGFLDKHLIVAMLDKDMIFNEALDDMAGEAYEEE